MKNQQFILEGDRLTPAIPLSQRQAKVYQFIENYIHKYGKNPSLKDIANYLAITIPSVYQHVSSIRTKGYISPYKFCPNCGRKL